MKKTKEQKTKTLTKKGLNRTSNIPPHTSKNGITLIALVITIIVMLILVAVTITIAVNGGLFDYAGKAVGETQNAINAEQTLANGRVKIDNTWYDSINDYINKNPSPDQGGGSTGDGTGEEETISTTESYVGYYADIDGDGEVDGVIYADLAIGNTGDGEWGADEFGTYTIPTETGLKEYKVSQTNYNGSFGTKDVLTAVEGDGNDRFYVMALEDISTDTYFWYYSAQDMSDYDTATSEDFGTGKANTEAMIEKWNNESYGPKDGGGSYKDMWGQIQTQVANGWFVPSRAEWSAFAEELGISSSNFADFGLNLDNWSSTQYDTEQAWWMCFVGGYWTESYLYNDTWIRMSATF